MPYAALRAPCPICGCLAGWEVTNDSHAYCVACAFGTATDGRFINYLLETVSPDGSRKVAT